METEINQIIEDFIIGLKHLLLKMDNLIHFLQNLTPDKVVSSAIESKIQNLIAEYKAEEYKFCLNLTRLYAKEKKPHPLSLKEIIGTKEKELQAALQDIRSKGLDLYDELLGHTKGIDPMLLLELNKVLDGTFEDLQKSYKEMVHDPHKSESDLRDRVLRALAATVANIRGGG